MKCPVCMNGIKPEYLLINPTDKQITDHMNKDHDVNSLAGHLLWGHPQVEVTKILMKYITDREGYK